MTVEPDNSPEMDETVNDENITDDNSDEWDYHDPDDDDPDPVDTPDPDETEDDEEEGTTEEEATEEEAEPEAEPVVYAEDTAVVKMADGTEVPLADLKSGYLRQNDYTRKTQELANVRKTVETDVQRMQRITEVFVDHISGLVPEAPDASLAYSDPNKYTAMKAQHEAAMGQVQKLIELGEAPKEIGAGMSEADKKQQLQEANQRLIEMFPEVAEGEGRKQFFGNVQAVANEIGFSDDDLGSVSDPRIFALAHWAKKGMDAEKARTTAKAKVAKAPPATPRKPGQGARKPNGNAEAMRKLSRSGSLKDALSIDFD